MTDAPGVERTVLRSVLALTARFLPFALLAAWAALCLGLRGAVVGDDGHAGEVLAEDGGEGLAVWAAETNKTILEPIAILLCVSG